MAVGYTLEELSVGDVFDGFGQTITEDAVIAFAALHDPLPLYRDRAAAAARGGLRASPFQLLTLAWRLVADLGLFTDTLVAVTGMEDVHWLRPVAPGDTVRPRAEVLALDPSTARPDRGFVRLRISLLGPPQTTVFVATLTLLLARQPRLGSGPMRG